MKRVAFLLALATVAGAAAPPAPSPFVLNSRWTLDFRQAGTGRSVGRVDFTVVSVEQSAGTVTGFGLVQDSAAFSVVAVMDGRDGTLTVTHLTRTGPKDRDVRVCAFGTERPPNHSGLTLTVPSGQVPQVLATLKRRLREIRTRSPRLSPLAQLRVAAGLTTGGAICTVRRAR